MAAVCRALPSCRRPLQCPLEHIKLLKDEVAVLRHWYGSQRCATLLANLLPRHNVCMVVECRNNHLVTNANELSPKCLRYEVYALSSATNENNLLSGRGIDEATHFFAGFLVGIGGTSRQRVGTTMYTTNMVERLLIK